MAEPPFRDVRTQVFILIFPSSAGYAPSLLGFSQEEAAQI
jgi:hypothetical protein